MINTIIIYEPSKNLPKEGWLQRCTSCDEITGNTMNVVSIIETLLGITHEYIAYICVKCENKLLCRVHYVDETIHKLKYKFFKSMNRTIITHLTSRHIYKYNIVDGTANTSQKHSELTESLRKYTYFPVEPNPPAPLDVSSSSSTSSTPPNGDKSGVQI